MDNNEGGKVVRPKFDKESFPNAVIREGLGESSHFVKVKTVCSASSSTPPKWRPTDGDRHLWTKTGAVCQVIYKGV